MSMPIPQISDRQVENLVADLHSKGFGFLPNYIHPSALQRMQFFVDSAIEKSHNEYAVFNGPDAVSGSGLDELSKSPDFLDLMKRIYEQGTGKHAPNESFYQVLRCLAGSSGQKNSLIFHYDSYIVTALVPIRIPHSGRTGDLLMFPNTRSIRPAYILNAVDKMLLDNPLSQMLLRASVDSKRWSPIRIKMIPGNIYFFWGYRSVHTNEPCDPDKVRATALFHYANPHRKGASVPLQS